MEFHIADTFLESLARLTGDEQKAAKNTAFDLQTNPANPSLQFHKLDKPKDPRFWSVRVNLDLRIIVHRTPESLLLCYVGHHDAAYQWAQRRKLETHPKTGAAQIVEIIETTREIETHRHVEPAKPLLFKAIADEELLSYGVPTDSLPAVRQATEDTLLDIAGQLPAEAGEALLNLATGVRPKIPQPAGAGPFQHPDAQRRFRVIHSHAELERALDYPWEKWTIFLHPDQRQMVERDFKGPARVAGSAGTGKTIVALHRAVYLARANPDTRVLLTTFSEALSNALRTKLRRLIGSEPSLGERLEVHAMNAIGRRLYELNFGRPHIASTEKIQELLQDAAADVKDNKFSRHFLFHEWEHVVDAWQLETWDAYRDVVRLGRKTRLTEPQRTVLWSIFERVRAALKAQSLVTQSEIFHRMAVKLAASPNKPFDFAVVDEAQDISVAQLRFLAALGGGKPNALFFAGDLGQRIFQQPFSWKALGVDVRGRSFTLRTNYRTSHQIRQQADRLLGPEVSDVDGNTEERKGTVSTFNGPPPQIKVLDTEKAESQAVSEWLTARAAEGVTPTEIGIFVRSEAQLPRARAAADVAKLPYKILDEHGETTSGRASISTMHLAKGLEFRAVVVMACDDEVIPLQSRIETATDPGDLEEVYATERHLLYVACTRARDYLLVTGVRPASEFLGDLGV